MFRRFVDRSAGVERSGRRKRRGVSGRYRMRKRDFHVTISDLKPCGQLMHGGNEARLIVEKRAWEGYATM